MNEKRFKEVAEALLKWYEKHGRDFLPWRGAKDPNAVLVAEFLLQRTRAETIQKIYHQFLSNFGAVKKLASTSPEKLQCLFRKLGLFYRGERLIQVSKEITEKYGGEVPCDMEKLLKLHGVGVYMASAVLNFGCGVPTPVVDKNVLRVLNRLAGITKESQARRFIEGLYRHGDHVRIAYALIDLGALVCKERPNCNACPLCKLCPKYPLKKAEWRMLRKVIAKNGRVELKEQPVYSSKKKN